MPRAITMNAIAFDTLQFTKRLTRAGATPQLAEATAEAFKEASGQAQLATKRDIDQLESRIDAGLSETKSEMQLGFAEVNRKIDAGLAETKNDMIKWVVGLTFAQIALLLGILIKIT
uniref:DUF1640 domain-containing protein n=1 Tax=Candidatus Kentrum sp. SD TaxID=2126332 RepID=A0A450Y5I0_9GAMM|nr:MAG: hypothetical protein BECKSD772F_GA0070984_100534 [Candidatus Kentron sp. SD]VFK40406.1 MAG: hypothetical protein BECKSD772E_GA0070983_100634 [Candidatus Kentron sp. SD]VFK78341.1 MAG: hypothetical protein BECKSD772D_GA0070982_101218 [Candidatus Kentron sp. SD]